MSALGQKRTLYPFATSLCESLDSCHVFAKTMPEDVAIFSDRCLETPMLCSNGSREVPGKFYLGRELFVPVNTAKMSRSGACCARLVAPFIVEMCPCPVEM